MTYGTDKYTHAELIEMSRLLEVERFLNDKDKLPEGYNKTLLGERQSLSEWRREIKKCHSQSTNEEMQDTHTR